MNYRWNFSTVLDNLDVLMVGAYGTLRLFALCLVVSVIGGLVVGLGRYARSAALYWPATAFVEFFRNTPVLVLILWFYFAAPLLMPVDISPMMAAALGISLNSAAFSAEIWRGGIQSIDPGQWEAAKALGMSRARALSRMLPALTNRGIEIFKMTTLASAVAYVEMLQQGKLLSSIHFNPIETYTVIAVVFFFCLLPLVQMTYLLERRMGRVDR
jgi:polar amino acid transport system permease protein